jgi:Pyridoxamine 5'-phosphate oxidase
MDVLDELIDIAHAVAWCTVATVDRHGRPRSRILHPVWERRDDGLRGWVGTTTTPLKVAHLRHSPYVSCSYWHPSHDTAQVECAAAWVTDDAERIAAWERFRTAPAPVGYDPAPIWPEGPTGPSFAVIRLDAWRVRLRRGTTAGRPFAVWTADAAVPTAA